jgi:hypothetical protein
MSEPIVYVDSSRIREGKLDAVKEKMRDLAEFVDGKEPQLISYGFFLDEDEKLMTVVAVHPDSESLLLHMDVGAEKFRAFGDLIDLERIDVYGRVSDAVMDRLRQKAEMLGTGTVAAHELYAGFARVRDVATSA